MLYMYWAWKTLICTNREQPDDADVVNRKKNSPYAALRSNREGDHGETGGPLIVGSSRCSSNRYAVFIFMRG
jgi:hypothetical protein